MAQKIQVQLVDDLDGESTAEETVAFSLDGTGYEIDLSEDHAAELRDALAPYVGAARKTSGRRGGGGRRPAPAPTGGGRPRSSGRNDVSEVRSWAREQGLAVSERGRISREVQEAYDAAH